VTTSTDPGHLVERPRTRFAPPHDLTAPEPPEERGLRRDGVRLLVADPSGVHHTHFDHLGEHLRPGDVLVVNTSATVPGQLDAHRAGQPIVVHLANRLPDGSRVVELRSQPRAAEPLLDGRPGDRIDLDAGGRVELLGAYPHPGSSPTGRGNRLWRGRIQVPGSLSVFVHRHGRPISYGYLDRSYPIARYQTIFALHPGSAEMPSAGRPFSTELATRLVASGVVIAPITLHTGVSSQEVGEGPQEEWYEVPVTTAALVNDGRRRGGRVVAVGTTVTRALESAAEPDGTVRPRSGWTDLVISRERPVRVVEGLMTGWHDPEASHLLLVEAVAGAELTQRAYDAAASEGYRWHEFGDSGLLLPEIQR
jgi:S-adenosylmethionine:tRNA ribosyltransferase-isomerase